MHSLAKLQQLWTAADSDGLRLQRLPHLKNAGNEAMVKGGQEQSKSVHSVEGYVSRKIELGPALPLCQLGDIRLTFFPQ